MAFGPDEGLVVWLGFFGSGWFVWCPSPTSAAGPPSPSWARDFDWNAAFSFSIGESVAVRPDEGIPASI